MIQGIAVYQNIQNTIIKMNKATLEKMMTTPKATPALTAMVESIKAEKDLLPLASGSPSAAPIASPTFGRSDSG